MYDEGLEARMECVVGWADEDSPSALSRRTNTST